MKLIRLLKHDIVEGTVKNWFKFGIAVMVALFQTYAFHGQIMSRLAGGIIYEMPSLMDYVMYAMEGMPVYKFDLRTTFQIPIYWFAFQIGIAYIVAYYPMEDFKDNARQRFLAVKSRSGWWLSKCIWCIISVLLYFALMVGTTAILAMAYGAKHSFSFSENIMGRFYSSNFQYIFARDAWMIAIILPCLITMAITVFQILLSFFLTPTISFAAICGLYVLSAYYTSPLLPGNYAMWQRSTYLGMNGVNPETGVLFAVILLLGSVLAGTMYFEKCDVI